MALPVRRYGALIPLLEHRLSARTGKIVVALQRTLHLE